MDPTTNEWQMSKRDIIPLFKDTADHELLGG